MKQRYSLKSNAVKFRLLTLTLLTLLCLGGNRAWAWYPQSEGTYYLRSTGTGNYFNVFKANPNGSIPTNPTEENCYQLNGFTITGGTYRLVFENTSTIIMYGQIYINAGATTQAHLIMELGTPPTNETLAAITLKITGAPRQNYSGQDVVFFLANKTDSSTTNNTITIQGNDDSGSPTFDPSNPQNFDPTNLRFNNNFVIDGDGPVLTAVGAQTMSPQVQAGTVGSVKNYGMFRIQQGGLHLKNVTVQNFSTTWSNGGTVQVFTNNQTAGIDLEFDHCLFTSIGATNASVLRMQGNGGTNEHRNASIKYCRFENTFGSTISVESTTPISTANATIRTFGNNKTPLTIEYSHINQNYGCPVRWHGCGTNTPMKVYNCLIENNFTRVETNVNGGGGLLLKGPADIQNCTIRSNRTNGNGGGIYLSTYTDFNGGTKDLIPEHSILKLDSQTKIYDNIAQQNGGGVAIEANLMRNTYYNYDNALTPYNYYIYFTRSGEPFKTQFIQNGGQVYNNTALGDYGGGVYISRSNQTPFYEVICSLDYGKVYGNTATNGKGGGVAVKTYNDTETQLQATPPADVAAQDVIVEMSYQDADPTSTSDASKMLIYGNEAIDGGGVYVEAYENTLPKNPTPNKVEVNVYGLAKVSNNKATNNGGGLYVEYGTVRINSGTIGGSTTEVSTTPVPTNGGNTAGLDGGGIYLNTGNIFTDVAAHAEPTGGGGGSRVVPTPPTPVLPEGFQDVEYITSTGGEVNTGIMANASHVTWAKVKRNGSGNMIAVYAVKNNNDGNNRFGCRIYGTDGHIVWHINGTGENEHKPVIGNVDGVFEVRQDYKSIVTIQNGVSRTYNYPTNAPASGTINDTYWKLLANTSWGTTNGNLYEAKIWDGDPTDENNVDDPALLGWFIPCVKTDGNVVGVYDIKRNMFIAGTGNLTAGPTVRSGERGQAMSHSGNSATMVPSYSTNRNNGGSRAAVAGCTISYNTANHDGGGGYVNNGNLFLMQTKVDHNTATSGRGGGVYTNGGNVFVNYWDGNNPTGGTNYSVRGETTASEITNNTAGVNGGGVNTHSGLVYMRGQSPTQDILISGNTAQTGSGGGIFCMGGGSANTEYVRLINVNMDGNKVIGNNGSAGTGVTAGCGGGVYLQQGIIEIRKCGLTNNTAYVNGGGINNHSGTINVRGTEITGNKAGVKSDGTESDASLCSGGGIFTVRGDVNLYNYTDGASTYHQTVIQGNSAKSNGGGITTRQGKVFAVGDYQADHSQHIVIRDNTAIKGSGGGVFCLGDPSATTLVNYIDFTNVDMINNKAESGVGTTTNVTLEGGSTLSVTNGCGGGIYLQEGGIYITNSDLKNNYAHYNGGGINNHSGNILVEGCLIGGDTYYNSSGTGHGNKANHSGGGIYTNRGNIILLDNVVEGNGSHLHIESKVSHNEAVENGGGMDTKLGSVFVNFNDTTGVQYYRDHQIEITHNRAKKGGGIYANAGTIIAANALIDNNVATENGGGINNHAGNITVYGGSLSNNKAREGKGGGVFTMVGDIDIMPFPVRQANPTLNHGTKVYNNIAKLNGGGINNHIGLVDARHASIRNNTSTLGNGGGIYCEGPHSNTTGFTIRLLCSELMQNKTRGQDGTAAAPTGRGGGIYLKYGSIYAHASQILYNEANINGGGIDNHEGDMLLYGCDLIGNKALTGRGGGIYTHAGDITTGPCISRTDANKSRATVIQQNVAHINGGGINNHQGNIYLNGDLIGGLDNSDPANPVSLGNVAETGHGGGIYIANGVIDMFGGNISYNTAAKGDGGGVWSGGGEFNIQKRQGKPVVEIVDIDTIGTDKACIHYHIIDKGGDNSTTLTEHGIKWGTGSPTEQVIFSTSTTGHYNGDEAGCHRIVVSSLTPGTTYYASAYAKNSKDLSNQCDSVPFTTRSNLPVVITGTVSDITADSAAVYSKLVYDGGSDIIERGVVWADYGQAMTNRVPSRESTDFYLTYIVNNTGVNDGDTVWLKAYAQNANGYYGYGDTLTFISPKDLPDMGSGPLEVTSMTLNNGKYNVTFKYTMATTGLTAFGFVTSTDDDPELHADQTIPGTNNTTHFTATATGLEPSTTYYVSAYASKIANPGTDITNYAITTPVQFITPSADGKPVVRAVEISGITRTEATIHGELIHKGNANITKYGVCYSTSSTTPTEHGTNCQHIDLSGTWEEGTIKEFGLGNLLSNTTYYVRLYATNSIAADPAENDIAYSNPYNFTTLPESLPSVTVSISSEEDTDANNGTYKATVSCEVHDGGSAVTEYGIYWKQDGAAGDSTVVAGTNLSNGLYTIALTGLAANTKYWVMAYAKNSVGTFTGRKIHFTTSFTKPTFDAVEIVSINYDAQYAGDGDQTNDNLIHSITVKGSIDNNGSLTPSEFGFVYSVSNDLANLTVENTTTNEWDCGHVTASQNTNTTLLDNVNGNKKYYIRPYAKVTSTFGTEYTYGDTISVITMPQVRRGDSPTNITNNSATLHGIIQNDDPQGYIKKYGFCWKKADDQDNPTPPATLTIDNADGSMENDISSTYTNPYHFSGNANLDRATKYYWRAYVKNKAGSIAYSTISTSPLTTWGYHITTSVSPSGTGTVSGGGGYDEMPPTLTATAATGYAFSHWDKSITADGENYTTTLNCSTDNPFNLPGFEDGIYTANFNGTVSWTVNGSGTVSPTAGVSSNGAGVASGTSVTLNASPTETFTKWIDSEGEVVSTIATCTFTMGDAPVSLTAVFSDGTGRSTSAAATQNGTSTGSASTTTHTSRPRDIYPAPAREPWDWEEYDLFGNEMISEDFGNGFGTISALQGIPGTDTLPQATDDTLALLRERLNRAEVEPQDIPLIQKNQATKGKGGGIYMTNDDPEHPTKLVFSGPTEPNALEHGRINFNYAGEAGGGIYINEKAYMQMKGYSEVNGNHVPVGKLGGGIYLAGRLYVGDKNSDVPTGENPVIHALRVNMNYATNRETSEIIDFFDGTHSNQEKLASELDRSLNNIFLPVNDYDFDRAGSNIGDDDNDVITLLSDISGKDSGGNNYTSLGFNVVHGFCPVIATSKSFGGDYVQTQGGTPGVDPLYESWLHAIMPSSFGSLPRNGAIFEDTDTYIAIHTTNDSEPFRSKYIYLWGSWTNPAVSKDPERNTGPNGANMSMTGTGTHYKVTTDSDGKTHWEIYSEEGLSWFSSYVNGLNDFNPNGTPDSYHEDYKWDKDKNPYATAKLMNDLDMSRYFWVPIGSVTKFNDSGTGVFNPSDPSSTIYTDNHDHHFKGEFDGQGHIVKGLDCRYLTGIEKFGMFGELAENAVVKNVFVDESQFFTDKTTQGYMVGGIAGSMTGGATLSGAEARSHIDVNRSLKSATYVGGLVGKMEGTAEVPATPAIGEDPEIPGTPAKPAIIHSSMAMPEIVGTAGYMGGLVGQVGTDSKLLNSFANPYFPNATTSPYYDIYGSGAFIGGLVGDNQGIVENCYTRLQGNEPTYDGTHSVFGWFAGTNSVEAKEDKMGGIRFCYAPAPANPTDYVKSIAYPNIINGSFGIEVVNPDPGTEEPFGSGNYDPTDYVSGCGKYYFKHHDQQITPDDANRYVINGHEFLSGLLPTLNNWVTDNRDAASPSTNYSSWSRTMASPINDDLPILLLRDFNSVGSKDKIYLLYEDDVNHLWNPTTTTSGVTTPGKDFKACNVAGSVARMYMYDAQPKEAPNDPNSPRRVVSITGNTNVPLHIHEDVGITQNESDQLTARVGVTIRDDDWHLFSSALIGAPMGLVYGSGGPVNGGADAPESVYTNRSKFDPESKTSWQQTSTIYFPTNTPYGTWKSYPFSHSTNTNANGDYGYFDLYDYSESYYHWINYKRNDDDHWHMDEDKIGNHKRFIEGYTNDRDMVLGKGYLMALSDSSMMMADGILNNAPVPRTLEKSSINTHLQQGEYARTDGGYTFIWRGIHLLGNPFQSYLDFNAQSSGKANGKVFNTYAIVDESLPGRDHYIYYTKNQSRNAPLYADGYIHPHQGFFVKVEGTQTFEFTTDMRIAGTSAEYGKFRDNVDYPLVNLLCFDEDGERDLTTVEVNRPEVGGGEKMESLHKSKGMIYAQFEGESFQVLFAPEGVTTVPVRFEAKEDGVFTLNWHTLHGNFSYLHLIDNITGVDVDCLTANEYKFEGKTSDYRSRFKLVFRCEGDEPEDPEDPDMPEDEDPDHFAFIFGNELVVNGEGILQMFDIQGRCLMETQAVGSQSNHNLPRVSAGVYLLRLTSDKKVRVQKMVIK